MGLQQRHRTHHPPGGALGPLGVGGRQLGEIGFPFGDAQVELAGQGPVLHPQQAVDHLIQLVLAGQEALLRPMQKMVLAVALDPGGQLRLPEHIGFRQFVPLQVVLEVVGGAEAVVAPPGLLGLLAFLLRQGHPRHGRGDH